MKSECTDLRSRNTEHSILWQLRLSKLSSILESLTELIIALTSSRIKNSGVDNYSKFCEVVENKLARLYRNCRKMVGSNGTMIAIRLVRSKLRKREDHHSSASAVHPEAPVVQTATSHMTIGTSAHPDDCCTQISTATTTTDVCDGHVYATAITTATTPSANPVEPFAWQFPPPYPPPHMPSAQYALYNDQVGTLFVLIFYHLLINWLHVNVWNIQKVQSCLKVYNYVAICLLWEIFQTNSLFYFFLSRKYCWLRSVVALTLYSVVFISLEWSQWFSNLGSWKFNLFSGKRIKLFMIYICLKVHHDVIRFFRFLIFQFPKMFYPKQLKFKKIDTLKFSLIQSFFIELLIANAKNRYSIRYKFKQLRRVDSRSIGRSNRRNG